MGSKPSYPLSLKPATPRALARGSSHNKRIPINEKERQKRLENCKTRYPYYGANGQVGWIDQFIFDEDLILIAEDGGFFGSKTKPITYMISGKTWVNNHAHVLRAKNNCRLKWLNYSLMFYNIGEYVGGTTRLKLNKSDAESLPISIPPVAIQDEIISKLDEISSNISKIEEHLSKQIKTAELLPNAVLKKAFCGELVN